MVVWCCANCDYLDKSRTQYDEAHCCFRYGCNFDCESEGISQSKYICGQIRNDKQLKTMGCSSFKHTEIEQFGNSEQLKGV